MYLMRYFKHTFYMYVFFFLSFFAYEGIIIHKHLTLVVFFVNYSKDEICKN